MRNINSNIHLLWASAYCSGGAHLTLSKDNGIEGKWEQLQVSPADNELLIFLSFCSKCSNGWKREGMALGRRPK